MAEERAKVRVVRCPKCDKLLPELANFTVYRCGCCNATLQAKKRSPASEASSEKSDGDAIKYLENNEICSEKKAVVVSDSNSETDLKVENVETRKEEKKLALEESPASDSTLMAGSENEDDLKEPEIIKFGESPIIGRTKGRDVPNANFGDLVQEKVEEEQKPKMQSWRSRDGDRERTSAFHRPNSYPDEGPSNYRHNPSKRKNLDAAFSAEPIDQDRAELLRKFDELREQLRKSCEVAEKPKERPFSRRETFSSNPYAHNNWFPENSSSLNRTFSRNSPFMNGHNIDIPNLYPHTGNFGYRAPFHPHAQHQRPVSNCLYGQFDLDPLISYHHDGFYHQPACSCMHCCNSHWPPINNNQRVPYYPVEGPLHYNQRASHGPLSSSEPCYRQRSMFTKKDGPTCRPVAGAAPFVSCYNCFELLQLPEDILLAGKNRHKLRCGSCSHLISFEYDGKRIITPSTENNNESNRVNNTYPANPYSGSFNSTDYEVHSADEKLVLPSYPASTNEAIEKEFGYHMSESEKAHGLSSSNSPDSMICQRDVPSSTELQRENEGISRVPSLPLREHFGYPSSNSNQVVDGPGNADRSRRSDQERIVSMNVNFKQNSVKDVPVASEMELSTDEYPDAGLSQDSWEFSKDEDRPRAKNSKSGESFFAGLIKKSFRDGRSKASINGHPISDRLVKKAEKLAGPIHPGNYWYDYRAGFWGVMGQPCLGIIPPFIEEFNYPMPKNCSGGNSGVFVNGRELHQKDLALLVGRGLPASEGQSYIVEISGKVWDEITGEELDCLGKLAPTIEKVKHGFGMRVPRIAA